MTTEKLPPLLMYWILGKDGRTPVHTDDILAWGDCIENLSARLVGCHSKDNGNLAISTIFFGFNETLSRIDPPLFETTVFRTGRAIARQRYHTWEQAEQGHREVCKEYGVECNEQ